MLKPSALRSRSRVSRRHRRIHRQDGAEDRTDAHQDRNGVTDAPDQARHGRRLGGVVVLLEADLDVQLRIGRQPVLERVERRGRVETRQYRLIRVTTAIDALQQVRVAPDFRLRHRAGRFKDAHNLQRQLPGLEFRSEIDPGELPARRAADDGFVGAEREHAARHQRDFVAHLESRGLDTAQRDVGRRAGGALVQIHDDVELGRRQGPIGIPRQSGSLFDRVRAVSGDAAGHLRVCAAAHDEHTIRRPGNRHRCPESFGDRQHRHEHDHHAGNADDRDDRRSRR